MWLMQWEIWIINNTWFVSWPYSDAFEAWNEAIKLMKDDTFEWKGNLCVVEILWNYDDYSSRDEEWED